MASYGSGDQSADRSRLLSRKLGLAMAVASTVFGFLYLIGLGVNLATSGSPAPSGGDIRAVSAVIALLWNLTLVVLIFCLRREAEPGRAVLAEVAAAFAVMVCVSSSARWFLGLTPYAYIAQRSDPGIATLLDPYHPASLPYALEHLGWGLFFGLAMILTGLSLDRKSSSSWLRWALIIAGTLSLAHFVGILASSEVLTQLGYVSWGVALPIATLLLAFQFRRQLRSDTL